MAVADATKEALWLRGMLKELGYEQPDATTIFEDNQGCIAISKNPSNHDRTKRNDIKFHFISDRVSSKEIILRYISTADQLADMLTKGLPRPQFEILRDATGIMV